MKNTLLIALGMLALTTYGCGNQGTDNPSKVEGNLTNGNNSVPISGATLYVPDYAPHSADSPDPAATASCGTHGGLVSCDAAPEDSCAQTCSCSDGSFSLDLTGCTEPVSQINYCVNGSCQTYSLQCSSDTCEIDLGFSSNPTLNLESITGSYQPNFSVQNPCTTDPETQELWINVKNGSLTDFEQHNDADHPNDSQNRHFKDNVLTYSYFNSYDNASTSFDCQLTFNLDGTADEVCTDTATQQSCNFAYTKCSDVYGQDCP